MTFHPSLFLPFTLPLTINLLLFRVVIQSQPPGVPWPPTPPLMFPSSTQPPPSLFPPVQAPSSTPLLLPRMTAGSRPMTRTTQDPDEAFLRGALHQIFETDRNVAQLSSQGHTLMRVLAELQSLPARVASEFALLNARVDQLTETIQVIDSTLREVRAISVRNHLNLPSVEGFSVRCKLCAQHGHSWRICPVRPPGHKCERCLEPDHLEIGCQWRTRSCPRCQHPHGPKVHDLISLKDRAKVIESQIAGPELSKIWALADPGLVQLLLARGAASGNDALVSSWMASQGIPVPRADRGLGRRSH